MKKLIFSILIFIFIVGSTLGVLEAVVRVRQWVKFGSLSTLQEFVKDEKIGLRIPKASSKNGPIQVNSLGFRGPEILLPKPPGVIRLAFLGGSTTWCAEASHNETTWPHIVWGMLQEKFPSREFDYVNAGIPGYSTKESLINLVERVQQTSPDVIFIYHGTNDVSYDTRKLAREQGIFQGKPENSSWVADYSLAWFLVEKNLQLWSRKQQVMEGSQLLEFEPSALSKDFKRRLLRLIRKSKEISPFVSVATFSHQYRKDQDKVRQLQAAETSIYYMPYMNVQKLFSAFEEYNRVITQLVRTEDVILIDGENYIPGDSIHFNDSVHFKDQGSQKMAERVIKGILSHEKFVDFVELKPE